ncbi:MAG: hypothetical protein HQK57_04660 [Deltaproteobacteria bacterium]|nr:hypothetical protein [Deltaproteobacteria bacterium]
MDFDRDGNIAELTRRRNHLAALSDELSAELGSTKSEEEADAVYLQSLTRDFALTTRKIKDLTAEIFYFEKKRTDVDEGSHLLLQEFERSQSELDLLKEQKQAIDRDTPRLAEEKLQTEAALDSFDHELSQLRPRVEELELESDQLASQVNNNLTNEYTRWNEVELGLTQMMEKLLGLIRDRDTLSNQIQAQEEKSLRLGQEVDSLNQEIQDMEEIRLLLDKKAVLVSDLDKLNREVEPAERELDIRQSGLAAKREQLEVMSRQNQERMAAVASLEHELGPYLASMQAHGAAKEKRDALMSATQGGLTDLSNLFNENMSLGKDIDLTLNKIDAALSFIKSTSE